MYVASEDLGVSIVDNEEPVGVFTIPERRALLTNCREARSNSHIDYHTEQTICLISGDFSVVRLLLCPG
jgi:hypothetical protein